MPVYEFRCPKCQTNFDVIRPMSQAGLPAACPADGTEAHRVFSAAYIGRSSGGDDFDFGAMGGAGEAGAGGMDDDFDDDF